MPDLDDTICALSTAPGRAGIAVVRVSGAQALGYVGHLFVARGDGGALRPRRATLGRIVDPLDGTVLDQALGTFFPAPHSSTGEDVVELALHGSPPLVHAVLDRLCRLGARVAGPGEFTLRAFARGRIDLAQSEAVADLIEAQTLYQARVATRQLGGELAHALAPVKALLVDVVVQLESAVEFVEENLPVESRATLAAKLDDAAQRVQRWIASFRQGRWIREGVSVVVVGRPNVGKSRLFNALLAQERSIVTPIPGTTRDTVSETTSVGGVPVRLVDTAGVAPSEDPLELLGIERSGRAMADADALLLVVDRSRPPAEEDARLRARVGPRAALVVLNKADLPPGWTAEDRSVFAGALPSVEVSALTGSGIDTLHEMMSRHIIGAAPLEDVVVTNVRHCQALEAAAPALARGAALLLEGASEEFAVVELRAALRSLGEITGETTVEDLLDQIFARFCVGK